MAELTSKLRVLVKKLSWITLKEVIKNLNKRVNEETDSRPVEEEEDNLMRDIKTE